ncbi:MAG: TIR domain-containing protein [Blastocatellia bacterium]
MKPSHIFISHTSKDDAFVRELREKLAAHKLAVWDDARRLRGGARLVPEIGEAIETARQFIVVFSQNAIESDWVFDEIAKALTVEQARKAEGYSVIPLLLPDFKPAMLKRLAVFPDERLGIAIADGPSGLADAMPQILAALGERAPDDPSLSIEADAQPIAELILELRDGRIETHAGKTRVRATATLVYEPADKSRRTTSQRYYFTAPLGPIEADELRWYLEEYYRWPAGLFQERAARIEAQLPQWGEALYQAALDHKAAEGPLLAWRQVAELHERRFSVLVEHDLPAGASQADQAAANEAASALLTLPWELLRDSFGWLFQGKHAVRVRRTLPNRRAAREAKARLPIRILLVSPRPEDKMAGYIDHRISALPLVEALNELGQLAELTLLEPPTFPALQDALHRADEAGRPFDVIHFDGHGIYNREQGLGKLCFEKPEDSHLLTARGTQLIDADTLAAPLRDHRIPLVFLEACQSAQAEADPTASVAARVC